MKPLTYSDVPEPRVSLNVCRFPFENKGIYLDGRLEKKIRQKIEKEDHDNYFRFNKQGELSDYVNSGLPPDSINVYLGGNGPLYFSLNPIGSDTPAIIACSSYDAGDASAIIGAKIGAGAFGHIKNDLRYALEKVRRGLFDNGLKRD